MPQLDQVTFLSQFFWMTLIFLGFYLVLLKQYLPRITRILKFRKKNSNQRQGSVSPTSDLTDEQDLVGKGYSSLFSRALTLSRDEFSNGVKGSQDWLEKEGQQSNQTHLKNTNTAYIRFLGVTSLSQNLEFKLISGLFPSLLVPFFIIPLLKEKGSQGVKASFFSNQKIKNEKKEIPSLKEKGSVKSISTTSDKKEVDKSTKKGEKIGSTSITSPKKGKKK